MADCIRVGGGMMVGTGQPTEADLRRLRDEGFRSVVDLRVEAEGDQPFPPGRERAAAEELGLRHVHLPVPADRPPDEDMLDRFLQGWCPPVPFFRKRGVRTEAEINRERMALKALRGDFGPVRQPATAEALPRAEAALRAAAA